VPGIVPAASGGLDLPPLVVELDQAAGRVAAVVEQVVTSRRPAEP